LCAEAARQRPQQRLADDRIVLRLRAVGDVAPGERTGGRKNRRQIGKAADDDRKVAISLRRCSAMSPRNNGLTAGATSKSRS
jgi:hypothetical protein